MFIEFSELPGFQDLYLDYSKDFGKVKKYYYLSFRETLFYKEHFNRVIKSYHKKDNKFPDLAKAQYEGINCSELTQKNLDTLALKNTLCITTGQQLGILTGPLYTIYKIITAIKLSDKLNIEYPSYNFVPVFWMEGDDHDFDEIRSITLLDKENQVKTISYGKSPEEDSNFGSIGNLVIDDKIDEFLTELENTLKDTEFKQPLLSKIKEYYSKGKRLKDSFRDVLHMLFDEYGLVIFDPHNKSTKEQLIPLFLKEINEYRVHSAKLIEASAELESTYHAQVKVKPINLFYHMDDGRYSIEPDENEFKLKRKRKKFTHDEMIKAIQEEPEKFSPNVLLRPICQDYLIPSAFYIAGPGEIAYFAQANVLYNFYDVNPPILYPRASLTILEGHLKKLLAKFDASIEDVFNEDGDLKDSIIKKNFDSAVFELIDETAEGLESSFKNINFMIAEIDKTLVNVSDKSKEKIISYMNELKNKINEAQKRKYDTVLNQVDKLLMNLMPNNVLQEREFNIIYFMNKYGPDFLKTLVSELEIEEFRHQILEI